MKFIRSPLALKLAVLIVVIYATVSLVSLQQETSELELQATVLQEELTAAQQTNSQLTEAIAEVDSDESVAEIARNKLGLVSPGEIVFYDVGN
ncbi:MAG: septum formation initiator family protein [Eubacteriales bacterium]